MEKSLALSLVIGATVGATMRTAVGATIAQVGRLGQAVTDAERQKAEALKETARLDKTEKQIQGYRHLGLQVLEAGRAHRDAQDKVKALAREIAASEEPTKAQEKALAAARREVVRAAAAEEAKKQRLAALRGELNAANIDTRKLADAERKLAADMADAKAKVDQTTQSIGRLGDAMARAEKRKELGNDLGRQALKVGAAYLAMKKPIGQEGDFEHHLRAFGNTAGMTAEELEGVRKQIRAMSTDVNQSNQAILSGVEGLVGKGMGAKEALEASRAIGRAATATGASMEDMSSLSFSVMSNLHVPVDKLGKALDIMAQAGKEGGFELKDMAQQFPQLTASAAKLGLTGTEAVASLGAMLQVAMKGASDPSIAANNLANFLGKITSPEAKKNFQKLGVDIEQALADGVAAGQNPVEVAMQQIAAATGADLDKVMADAFDSNGKLVEGAADKISESFKLGELFGDKQVQDFLAPMLAGYQDYIKIKKKASEATGVVDQDYANMLGTYNEASKAMGLATDKLMGSIGKAVLPVITPIINWAADGVDALANLADQFPLVTGGLVALAGGFVAAKTGMLIGRYAMTYYRGGLGAVVRESLGVGRASGQAAAGVGRLGASTTGMGGRLGTATARLRQYTAAANQAAAASGRLARSQGGVGGLDGVGGGTGKLGKALRFGGKAMGGAGLALSAGLAAKDLMDPALSKEEKGAAGGNLAGAATGAAAGAAIGSIVPGVGTALGAIIGGALGSFGGEKLGGWLAKDKAANDEKSKAPSRGEKSDSADKPEAAPKIGSVAGEKLGGGPPKDKTSGGEKSKAPSAAEPPVHKSDSADKPDRAAPNPVSITFAPGAIVVHAAPGMDLRALADQVAQMIMQRQRAALAD